MTIVITGVDSGFYDEGTRKWALLLPGGAHVHCWVKAIGSVILSVSQFVLVNGLTPSAASLRRTHLHNHTHGML